MDACQEWRAAFRPIANVEIRFFSDQVGQIALLFDADLTIPQSRRLVGSSVLVREVIQRTFGEAPEVIVAIVSRPILGYVADVPLADQCRSVADIFKRRRDGRVPGGQARVHTVGGDRLPQSDFEAMLIAPGRQRNPRRRTNSGVRVGLRELHSLIRQPIDIRGCVVAATVTG